MKTIFEIPFLKDQFQISPNGKWVAYNSRESGDLRVSVAAFPSFTDRRQVSSGTGNMPRWRPDGKELFFMTGTPALQLSAVSVNETGGKLSFGPIQTLFDTRIFTSNQLFTYAAMPDGRFLLLEPVGFIGASTSEPVTVVLNWTSLLK
jgi:Tol biopolymer transport system component